MKKSLLIIFITILSFFSVTAKEGIWLPMLLQQMNESDMKSMGMRISAEDIYSINHSSLKRTIIVVMEPSKSKVRLSMIILRMDFGPTAWARNFPTQDYLLHCSSAWLTLQSRCLAALFPECGKASAIQLLI